MIERNGRMFNCEEPCKRMNESELGDEVCRHRLISS